MSQTISELIHPFAKMLQRVKKKPLVVIIFTSQFMTHSICQSILPASCDTIIVCRL